MTRQPLFLSASSIAMFKACPYRYFLHHVLGLRRIEETDSQRIGTNWHTCLELAKAESGEPCLCFARSLQNLADPSCVVCRGTGLIPEELTPLERVSFWLDRLYQTIPNGETSEDWAVEKETLANSVAGWLWYYQEVQLATVAREIHFDLPLHRGLRSVPSVRRVGKIDRIAEQESRRLIVEYKSTSKSLDSGSTFWEHLLLDTQLNMYLSAGRELNPPTDGILFDAWRKPQISPKKLTMAESAEFVKSGEYCGRKFDINTKTDEEGFKVLIEGKDVGYEPGKKEGTFSLRETPEMFGARLLQDITQRPEFYFARREIARTDKQLEKFNRELINIARSIRNMMRDNSWFCNEQNCEATFHCPFIAICYHDIPVENGEIPDGFQRKTNTTASTPGK